MKVIIRGSEKVFQSAILRLENEKLIKVLLTLEWSDQTNDIFSGATSINQWELIESGLSGTFNGADIRFLDSELIEKTSWSERVALSMMNRMDPLKNQTYFQRKNLYNYLLCYWAAYVKNEQPNALICSVAPHEVSDFILYVVCKAYNIKTIVINQTSIPGMLYISDSYNSFPYLKANAKSFDPYTIELPKNILDRLTKIRSSYDKAIPIYEIEIENKSRKWNKGINQARPLFLDLFFRAYAGLKRAYSLVKRVLSLSLKKDREELYAWIRNGASGRLAAIEWEKTKFEYTKSTCHFDKPSKYIYFLLNYQPECTTSPMGGEFVDQLLAISMIARNLPDDTSLLVKEHPAQFKEYGRSNYLGRDADYYQRISSIPKVQLVPINQDHFDLLDNSFCVACVNGTAGWEAAVRGKPSLVFGDAWYQGLPGSYKVGDDEECKLAIDAIHHHGTISDDLLKKYIYMFINECDEVCLDDASARVSELPFDFDKSANNLYEALTRELV